MQRGNPHRAACRAVVAESWDEVLEALEPLPAASSVSSIGEAHRNLMEGAGLTGMFAGIRQYPFMASATLPAAAASFLFVSMPLRTSAIA